MRATVAFFVALTLWIVTSAQPLATQPKLDFLAANIDLTVSPREDFFQYANGGWFKRNPIPADQGIWGITNLVEEDVLSRQRRVSEQAAAKKSQRGSIEQLIGDFWFAGMDIAKINKLGLAPLQPDLVRIDRIRSMSDLSDFVAIQHNRNRSVFFLNYIEQDEKNGDRKIYSLWQGGISMLTPQHYSASDPLTVKVREAFREYLFKTFLRLHQDSNKAKASANAVYDLEAQLAKAFYPGTGNQKVGLTELSRLAPTFDWASYFRSVGLANTDLVNLGKPRFFEALDSLLRTVPLENWKDYLRFWLINVNAPFLDDKTFDNFFAFRSANTGQLRPLPRWKRVLISMGGMLGQPLARLLSKEYLPANVKARYQKLGESIRDAFRDRITQLEWMSDTTKQNALLKLARLKINIGYPETWRDFSTMDLRRDSFVMNMIRGRTWLHDREIRSLRAPVDRTEWDPSSTMNNAGYSDSNNGVGVEPGSVVAPGLRDDELDDAFVYGYTYLGHEISHAFDSVGRHYDAEGNKVDWWTAKDAAAFLERAQVVIDQYNEFLPLEGMHVDGRRTLRENIADLAGVRIALDAFKKTEQFKKNEKIGGFTPLQRFFLAYAYRQMFHARPELLAIRVRNDTHAPDRERINGVLMNIPEFYEAFDVKPGDRMYRPENARVRIW